MTNQSKKIAVVDDNSLSRKMVVTALGSLSWAKVSSFADGEKAWEAFQNGNSADIVLTDVKMPRMNGLELLHKIKTKDPKKPCIIMTATPHYKTAARDLQADGFLMKPFAIADLFSVMERFASG